MPRIAAKLSMMMLMPLCRMELLTLVPTIPIVPSSRLEWLLRVPSIPKKTCMIVSAPSSRLVWLTLPVTSIPKKILMPTPVLPCRLEWPASLHQTVPTKIYMMMLGLSCRLVRLLMHAPMKIDMAGLFLVPRVFVEPTFSTSAAAAQPSLG
ncbi:unnamed protein product [Prorocentrum cordatum]|uniref:Secreted protein n=1 Tax=Prorocentrum cordatum TaxID=2364126 RepID=A0ABN9TM87_9DINO|nr:unnamed protein product [Polarella glacialis]|mmetsp:Transcript_52115/g.135705  ORF Transcript_52115/g.135705 Transcript_52115/m.135705 type:complete len:151 (-) Transcript_52115:136-588(-)